MASPSSSPSPSPSSSITFADLLRRHRVAAGLTQEELAERAGLSVDAISLLERGARRRPRKDTLALLAGALDLPANERAVFVAAARQMSAVSGSPVPLASFPPLRRPGSWSELRDDLTLALGVTAILLAVVGPLLALLAPPFPWAIGLVAAGLVGAALLAAALAPPLRRTLARQWRDARKPFAAVTSGLLGLVVVTTTLFITKPPVVTTPAHPGYDFTYTYHAPTHRGGAITIGLTFPLQSLGLYAMQPPFPPQIVYALSQSCLIELPGVAPGLASFRPDLCTEVPSLDNQFESSDYKTTTFHIDPRARWSDGVPITADDFVFANDLAEDSNLPGGGLPPAHQRQFIKVDAHTVRIEWANPVGFYLGVLAGELPLPLHVIATGPYKSIFIPSPTSGPGVYNSALAQRLYNDPAFVNLTPKVVNGPFMVDGFIPRDRAVLVRNPRYISNFFHTPALDKVTFVTGNPSGEGPTVTPQVVRGLLDLYRRGAVDVVDGLDALSLKLLSGVPQDQIVISPVINLVDIGFNQRTSAPNARFNNGASIFTSISVRKAFFEAFDRCAAVRAELGIQNCNDPNIFTNELTAPPAPDYDPSVTLPGFNPKDAARLMDQAGFHVVNGARRYQDGKTPIQLTIAISSGAADATIVVQRMQADYERYLDISVKLELLRSAGPLLWPGAFDIGLYGDTGAPDPILNAILILSSTDAQDVPSASKPYLGNFLGVLDSRIVTDDATAEQIQDPQQAAAIHRDRLKYVAGQYYVEPVFISADVSLLQPALCNFKKWPQFGSNTWNIADWYVARGPTCPS